MILILVKFLAGGDSDKVKRIAEAARKVFDERGHKPEILVQSIHSYEGCVFIEANGRSNVSHGSRAIVLGTPHEFAVGGLEHDLRKALEMDVYVIG